MKYPEVMFVVVWLCAYTTNTSRAWMTTTTTTTTTATTTRSSTTTGTTTAQSRFLRSLRPISKKTTTGSSSIRSRRKYDSSSLTSIQAMTSDSSSSSNNNNLEEEVKGTSSTSSSCSYQTMFDFKNNPTAIDCFERIDDVIMGGISTSSLNQIEGEPFARWNGICRLDGGGFCGFRTLPLKEPLPVDEDITDGFYIVCRLTSDQDTDRRVWKVTTRTNPSRGEELYQATFTIPPHDSSSLSSSSSSSSSVNTRDDQGNDDDDWWATIQIPFSDFSLVRGPRLISDSPPLNVSNNGIYQLGISMSKFQMAQNITEIENFRPGFFELQIREIGFYGFANNNVAAIPSSSSSSQKTQEEVSSIIQTLTKKEARQRQPILFRILRPLFKLIASEQSQRRKSAMRILVQQRGLSRYQAMLFGIQYKTRTYGMLSSIVQTISISFLESFRWIVFKLLRYGIVFPIVCTNRLIQFVRRRKNN